MKIWQAIRRRFRPSLPPSLVPLTPAETRALQAFQARVRLSGMSTAEFVQRMQKASQ